MTARIDDIRDVSRKLLNVLPPQKTSEAPAEPIVLVADQLLPGELLQLNSQFILGIVMGNGTVYSHTAILINVTIRTFDLGSDKTAVALPLEKEGKPALGIRGLRVYSLYPEAFKTQIRALLRAAVFGNLRIMYPMVTSSEEIIGIKQVVAQAAQELKTQNIPCRMPLQGAMIETPAAALLSDELAQIVDFFSVGTNDLMQYTLGLDRQNGHQGTWGDAGVRAILALVRMAAENARKHGIEIGICGEMASQPQWIDQWIQMGIDYLSVAPACLPNR